jgi:hypothetical protein
MPCLAERGEMGTEKLITKKQAESKHFGKRAFVTRQDSCLQRHFMCRNKFLLYADVPETRSQEDLIMSSPSKAIHAVSTLLGHVPMAVRASCAATAVTLLAATGVAAAPITYTIRADVSGSMTGFDGVVAMVSGPLTITAVGDTNDAPPKDGDTYTYSGLLSTSFDLAGFGVFSGAPSLFALGTMGPQLMFNWLSSTNGFGGFQMTAADGQGYSLESGASAGPLAYDTFQIDRAAFDTAVGWFDLSSVTNASFQATVASPAAVPEPASLSLVAGAGLALLLVANRRQKAKPVAN